ncbi:N-acetyl-gamma-glutamyl-phosphate reductase [Herpetosiphon geysericola]|uniref:Putative [LysW]-L-2-aminoadipate 6-phosphate reductase n=1 Tax=Herpetosiphon geysericola TaxID=70996 RepID=A0A0P6XMJ8_9CHLR|nr:N-acetyl-gamma-glutamyl-phosphate reductase [Herpetosiphon geysericola]KPL81571.1 N-acetyl-gamma-glutamyl-phosphate reductase [Herpetosiphon geysericola]
MLSVSIVGGSGYVGGELLRLLLGHPHVEVRQVTSERLAGQYVYSTHPNLRGRTDLRYSPQSSLEPCDVLILALPHGSAAKNIEHYAGLGQAIIDCSADFRLREPETYSRWYGEKHPAPHWLERFVYGLPELYREQIRTTRYVSGVGCNATAINLALLPLVKAGLIDQTKPVVAEVKVGSSEAGAVANDGSHHAERAGVVRSFAPVGHRHTAEIMQAHGLENVHISITSVEMVRGALATCHVFTKGAVNERDLWRAYRAAAAEQPFLRIVHDRSGLHRHPEPKILAGSNYADIGWALDENTGRVVALCALDNLMKGAAGAAIQCLNLMHGFEETVGLEFSGLHPV